MMEGDGVLSAHQGKDVQLECKANGDGDERGGNLWLIQGDLLLMCLRVTTCYLKVFYREPQKSDSGRYEYQASNPFGKS